MNPIPASELPVNSDGTIFHLHLKPENIADKLLLFGDPGRVTLAAKHLNHIECDIQNREFHTVTGTYNGKRITLLSHGIGTDNIDIVLTELDALANIDLNTRIPKPTHKSLTLLRIGTSGSLQPDVPIGTPVLATKSIGTDGLLNYYDIAPNITEPEIEQQLINHLNLSPRLARPYVVSSDEALNQRIGEGCLSGITISATGFYGPQGRSVRLRPKYPNINAQLQTFRYNGLKIINYEMESSALAGLAKALGHHATTVCLIIAGRTSGSMNTTYTTNIEELIKTMLNRI